MRRGVAICALELRADDAGRRGDVVSLEEQRFPHPWSMRQLQRFAEQQAMTPGCCAIRMASWLGYFLLMYASTKPICSTWRCRRASRGTGLGRQLLESGLCARAKEMGMESVLLEVRPSNDAGAGNV
jgi:ribosomal-protein-alanine N-acetyltransferase